MKNHMDVQPASTKSTLDCLSSHESEVMVSAELSDILADFIVTQEKWASQVSLVEGIARLGAVHVSDN